MKKSFNYKFTWSITIALLLWYGNILKYENIKRIFGTLNDLKKHNNNDKVLCISFRTLQL